MADTDKPSLVALARAREQATELLSQRFAEGVLELEEFEDRVERAQQATEMAALKELVSDLSPAAGGPLGAPASESDRSEGSEALAVRAPVDHALATTRPEEKRMIAILGGVDRKGAWTVPASIKSYTVIGGTTLDFREARLAPGVTEINVRVILGGVEIIVPPGVAVEADGTAILGGFEDMHSAPDKVDEDTPLLRISGLAIMGGVEIETRMPGESGWQARRRVKKEHRRMRKLERARQKALVSGKAKRRQIASRSASDDDET